MDPESDIDDDPPEFPILLWIPAICWMLHGAVILAATVFITALVFIDGGKSEMGILCLFPFFAAVGSFIFQAGRGILKGLPFSLPTVTWMSFLGMIFVPMFIVETDSYVFAVCEGAMFFLCGILGYHDTDAWFDWVCSKHAPLDEDANAPGD